MKLKFLIDYVGRETAMAEYKAGDVDDIPQAQAMELVRLGVAEEIELIEAAAHADPAPVFIEAQKKPRRKAKE